MAFLEVNKLISERIPIDKIISKYVKLEPSGTGFKGLCPFHKEKTPSFHVNTSEGFYYCFGCQATGNVITFLMEKESVPFSEAVRTLAVEYNINELLKSSFDPDSDAAKEREDIFNSNKTAAVYFHKTLRENKAAIDYLHKRGVNDDLIKKFGIGFIGSGDTFVKEMNKAGVDNNILRRAGLIRLDSNFRPQSFFYNRIMIPIINRKNVIGFGGRIFEGDGPKYINSPDTVVFNKKENLFGIDFIKEGLRDFPFVVLCEGYFDVIAMHNAGFKTSVAALGTAITSAHLDMMSRYQKPVVVFLDGDDAGRKAAARIASLKIPDKIDLRVAFIKEEGFDPDIVLSEEGGKEKVKELIETSRPLFQELIDEQLGIYNKLENLEEKIKVENKIRSIMKGIPRRKFRTYSLYVQKQSDNAIVVTYGKWQEHKRSSGPVEGKREKIYDMAGKEESSVKKIIVIASLYPSFVPACEKMLDYFISVNYASVVEKMIDIYYENGEMGTVLEKVDPYGEISSLYENVRPEFIDRIFSRIRAFLLRSQNERIIKALKSENSVEAVESRKKLLIENQKLKKIENDNFVDTDRYLSEER